MKKIFILLLLLTAAAAKAQQDAWVYFTDKPDAAAYLASPLQMLTQKALDRRLAHNVPLDEQDVPIHPAYITAVSNAGGITVIAHSKWLNALHIRGSAADIVALRQLGFVDHVHFADNSLNPGSKALQKQKPKLKAKHQGTQMLPYAAAQDFDYGQAATQIQMLNGHLLHQNNYTGTGMTIAVIDAGFPGLDSAPVFSHLYDNNQVLGGHNYVTGNDNVYTGGTHGTLIMSTLGGRLDGQIVGTAPDAKYYFFVTEDVTQESPVEESYWVQAAEAADSLGVDVINTSLGYFGYDNPAYSYTYDDINGQTAFITRGANVAFTRGMMLVASAGNSGATVDPHIGVPADAFNTLTIGAVDSAEAYAAFSATGPSADGRVKPDVMAMGQGTTYVATDGTVSTGSGTSFSSPITAGLVACLWQALPGKTNTELLQLIRASADRYTHPDAQYGYGIPDFWAAFQSGVLSLPQAAVATAALYPNPVTTEVHIATQQLTTSTIDIINNLGQVVLEQTLTGTDVVVPLSGLPAGIYYYKLSFDGKVQGGKLVKE